MWDPVLDRLAEGRRVFAYDVRGYGTAADAPKPFTMTATAADLVAVLDALELKSAHVAGLSLGGAIARAAAVAAPERFASLTLTAAPDRPVPEAFEQRARLAETEGMAAVVEPTLERWFTASALAVGTDGLRYDRDRVPSFDPAAWASIWRGYRGLDVYDRLRAFSGACAGPRRGADASIPIAGMAAIAARIGSGARFEVLPGAPHIQPLECPEALADALGGFLPEEIDIPQLRRAADVAIAARPTRAAS
ncbi:alpha/beta fold hydrolase [Amycolatopsis sp. RTGN1]|uniref:alpha/beta fold hydrolase n=1 Tax=Amycolatopsis ponsaeliensis TaxID=2992142 RepID=UPI00254D960E|nr:alpha/beta hydrolase [Amycolatopsis sp. RTGN1]